MVYLLTLGTAWLLGNTAHPDALNKISELEHKDMSRPEAPEPNYELPTFITHLNNIQINEGESAHFECRVEPQKDPTLKTGEPKI